MSDLVVLRVWECLFVLVYGIAGGRLLLHLRDQVAFCVRALRRSLPTAKTPRGQW